MTDVAASHERDPEIHEAFLSLACAILCFRRLQSFWNIRPATKSECYAVAARSASLRRVYALAPTLRKYASAAASSGSASARRPSRTSTSA